MLMKDPLKTLLMTKDHPANFIILFCPLDPSGGDWWQANLYVGPRSTRLEPAGLEAAWNIFLFILSDETSPDILSSRTDPATTANVSERSVITIITAQKCILF